jgi:hypothetical protein
MQKRTFQIYRYDPDKDAKPYMQTIEIELDGHERMLLDALMKLKAVDPDAVVPPLLPRRRLRLRRHEHQRQERSGLPDQHEHAQGHHRAQAAAGPAGDPRPDRGHDAVLQAVQLDQALPDQRQRAAREASACSRPRSAKSSTACTSAFCAPAAPPAAPASGGTPTSSSARPACCRPTASSPTAAIRPPASAWTTSKTPTACSAATRS